MTAAVHYTRRDGDWCYLSFVVELQDPNVQISDMLQCRTIMSLALSELGGLTAGAIQVDVLRYEWHESKSGSFGEAIVRVRHSDSGVLRNALTLFSRYGDGGKNGVRFTVLAASNNLFTLAAMPQVSKRATTLSNTQTSARLRQTVQ
ncbi:hypothetical protein RI367_004408 [Sorochytrium milnesiophthora]